MGRDAELEAYLSEAAGWDRDRAEMFRVSARRAWAVAGMGWIATLLALGAVFALTPLKTVRPFLIRVDRSTGVVDVVPELRPGASVPEAVTRYLLTHYVSVCERFNFSTAESDYEECGAFHSPQLNQAWYAKWNPANRSSPLNLYKDGTELTAEVSAVSFLTRANSIQDLAQVRYTVAKRTPSGVLVEVIPYIATLQYTYVTPSSDPKVRQWNPLGFRIVSDQTVRELAADAAPVSVAGVGR